MEVHRAGTTGLASTRTLIRNSDDPARQGATVVVAPQVTASISTAGVVDRVTPSMKLYFEESFGPIVAVVRVDGDDEAVRAANDSEYGLSAAVFSQNINRALDVAMRINDWLWSRRNARSGTRDES